jgi:hypothetical protein
MCLLLTVLVVALTRGIHYLWSESRATGGFNYLEVLDNERFIWTGPNIPKTPVFGTVHWPVENLPVWPLKQFQNSSQNQGFKTCPLFSFWDIIF